MYKEDKQCIEKMIEECPTGNRLNGVYKGTVVKHLSNGFCKIWIPSVYPEDWKDKPDLLPSAEQASPLFGGACNGNGEFSYPNIGSIVICMFFNGDQNLPVYFASTLGNDNGNWNSARPMAGSEDDAYVHKIHIGKSDIEIYETGFIQVKTNSGDNSCTLILDQDGNIKIDSTTQISLHAKNIDMKADTQMSITTPVLDVNVTTQANMKTPTYVGNMSARYEVISPNICLDASEGGLIIKSYSKNTEF